MSEPVIAADLAEAEYQSMLEVLDGDDRPSVHVAMVAAIMAGRLSLDGKKLVYHLAEPIAKDKGGEVDAITLEEPTCENMEYINRGMKVQASSDGKDVYLDMGDVYVKTRRMLTSVGKLELGYANRIRRRDLVVLGEICNFFG